MYKFLKNLFKRAFRQKSESLPEDCELESRVKVSVHIRGNLTITFQSKKGGKWIKTKELYSYWDNYSWMEDYPVREVFYVSEEGHWEAMKYRYGVPRRETDYVIPITKEPKRVNKKKIQLKVDKSGLIKGIELTPDHLIKEPLTMAVDSLASGV